MQPPPRSSEPADKGTKSGTEPPVPRLNKSDAALAKSRAHDEGLVKRAVEGDPQAFEELYELAFPGDELQVYFRNKWTRVPDLTD